jgi:septum formation topological specificity factor MinE
MLISSFAYRYNSVNQQKMECMRKDDVAVLIQVKIDQDRIFLDQENDEDHDEFHR